MSSSDNGTAAPGPGAAGPVGSASGAERQRLAEDARRDSNWKRWGPYLSERQWGTVREDYSADGEAWVYFPHDHARSRAYRWGEDGLLGITDRECRLCFALALWNSRDPILKERLFGLGGPEGNHGEDVKEEYFYLDATPTYSYMKALYKYPQAAFPYARLLEENRRRSKQDPEFEIKDTGVFAEGRYFDVMAEYAKASPDDLLIRLTVVNRGPEAAPLDLLPTLWFRNTWAWECRHEGCGSRPRLWRDAPGRVRVEHPGLGLFWWEVDRADGAGGAQGELLFTENETNTERIFGTPNKEEFVRDAFHDYVVAERAEAVNPKGIGSKAAARFRFIVPAGASVRIRLRLYSAQTAIDQPFGEEFEQVFAQRAAEADAFYATRMPDGASDEERGIIRSGYAGLLWSKQFYHYIVKDWLEGDPGEPAPPPERLTGRNSEWEHLYSRDVLSMPDKWEYPWFAAWDLAFHMIPLARVDPEFAKEQLKLLLREWYMHPNGQIPAYEYEFSAVNPPVHAWAAWRIYKITAARGGRDRAFLEGVFQKLLLNFTWWVNRKDAGGRNIFAGGFLGLDNIGVFDRSKPLPTGGSLEQADGTAWMAFYCGTMLAIALELACENPVYEDLASKFFEHYVRISDAMNELGGTGLWDPTDGFYYDQLQLGTDLYPMRIRSMVGLIPLIACEVLETATLDRLPGFTKRLKWFQENRQDLSRHIAYMDHGRPGRGQRLLAIPSRERLTSVLRYMFDESEFLSPYGIRSLSRFHKDHPYVLRVNGMEYRVDYVPGESDSSLFGGNSNWRGPVWFPVNFLLIEALERYHHFYGSSLQVECPTGSGRMLTLGEAAEELVRRLCGLFLRDPSGNRPFVAADPDYRNDPHWRDLILFHEYFDGDSGRGLGARHQTGWTALVVSCLEDLVRVRRRKALRSAGDAGPALGQGSQ